MPGDTSTTASPPPHSSRARRSPTPSPTLKAGAKNAAAESVQAVTSLQNAWTRSARPRPPSN
ncbi:hypothetical protein P4056_14800 [Pseudomonas aeruginosa]|nr:hypothetical protein [Pseudomonas aeruginosa]